MLHVFMHSTSPIEYLVEKCLNRLAVLFSGIAPAILEAQTWSHFDWKKKKRQALYHPYPSVRFAKFTQPILFTVNSSKDGFDICRLWLFLD